MIRNVGPLIRAGLNLLIVFGYTVSHGYLGAFYHTSSFYWFGTNQKSIFPKHVEPVVGVGLSIRFGVLVHWFMYIERTSEPPVPFDLGINRFLCQTFFIQKAIDLEEKGIIRKTELSPTHIVVLSDVAFFSLTGLNYSRKSRTKTVFFNAQWKIERRCVVTMTYM